MGCCGLFVFVSFVLDELLVNVGCFIQRVGVLMFLGLYVSRLMFWFFLCILLELFDFRTLLVGYVLSGEFCGSCILLGCFET